MNIPLYTFENHVDETILKRGLQYFKKGCVIEFEVISPGHYEAVVEGTEPYNVVLTVKNDVVTEYVCTCPYDFGPVCKHVVAVLFYLQKDELNLKVKETSAKTKTKPSTKRKSVEEQVDDILEKMSHSDLAIFVKDLCQSDKNFRQAFLANNAHLVIPESRELYAKQIKSIVKSIKGRKGYVDYYDSRYLGNKVYQLVQLAEKMLASENYKTAIYMATAVLEEMTIALEYADDSNGDIGGNIQAAEEILHQISLQSLPENLRIDFFNYCITTFKKEIFKGWDWHFSMLYMAVNLVTNTDEAGQINELLDQVKPKKSEWDWDFEVAQKIRLELLKKTESEEKVNQYIDKNLNNSDFRKVAIEKAIAEKDYKKAISLCEAGIKKDEKSLPGLANDWREYLLKVYNLSNDAENVVKYAQLLFFNHIGDKKIYFDMLKKYISTKEWDKFVEELIKSIANRKWVDYGLIAQIYIWEERWSDLLAVVKIEPSLHSLDNYEKFLSKEFPDEIASLYQDAILNYMKTNIGRNHYQTVCRYLRRMIKIGARENANYVIKQLQELYPSRKALMEELQRV